MLHGKTVPYSFNFSVWRRNNSQTGAFATARFIYDTHRGTGANMNIHTKEKKGKLSRDSVHILPRQFN